MSTHRIGLLGCGVVGSALIRLIHKNAALIRSRTGVDVQVVRAVVRDTRRARDIPAVPLSQDAHSVTRSDDIDTVVEVMGGVSEAAVHVRDALAHGKHVVTANKALLALQGSALFAEAGRVGRHIGYEASVCGGIPIIGALREGLVGNEIDALLGIVNGTSNFILSEMRRRKLPFDDALQEARVRGFCEADASFDIEGTDAAQKLTLLARLALGIEADVSRVRVTGMSHIEASDIAQAAALGFVIKHIATARRQEGDATAVDLRVFPALLPQDHPLAHVDGENNAVTLQGDAVGELLLCGKGAGGAPTASAVLADVVSVATGRPALRAAPGVPGKRPHAPQVHRMYVRLPIFDAPGAIGALTTALGGCGVSIAHASAVLEADGGSVVVLTHRVREDRIAEALAAIDALGILRGRAVTLPLLESEAAQGSRAIESPSATTDTGRRGSPSATQTTQAVQV